MSKCHLRSYDINRQVIYIYTIRPLFELMIKILVLLQIILYGTFYLK